MKLIQQNAPTSCKETHWILEKGGFEVLATVGTINSDSVKDRELAKLFAAAPDLLAACELAAKALRDHLQYDDGESLEREGFEAAEQAIAKASD